MSLVGDIEQEFFVQLFSNSTEKNVENTTAKFTNTLAKAISLPKREHWHVGLNFLLCSNKFDVRTHGEDFDFAPDEANNLSQIFVRCEQVSQIHDGRKLISCHSRVPYDRERNRIHYFEASNVLYFPVNVTELTDLTISLHKSNLEPLFMRLSQPTTVSLHFKKMSERLIPIYASSKGKGAQEGNKASKFTVDIPPYYNNYGANFWQIALHSISYVADFKIFPSHYSKNAYFRISAYAPNEQGVDEVQINALENRIQVVESDVILEKGTIDSWRCERDIRRYLHELMEILSFPDGEKMSSSLTFGNLYREESEGEVVTYTGPISLTFTRPCQFRMPAWLANILGFRQYELADNGTMAEFASRNAKVVFAKTKMDGYHLIPNSISVLCDFIQPLLVGGIESRVLRTIPVRHKFNEERPSETFEPKNWQFHNLASREVSSLSFFLVDIAGNEIEFANEDQDIIIGLVLKIIG